ncbi:MAG: NADH dehydrogenase-like protein [Bacteroidia bacterium]|nr:NADH dehydrogenase-like protein [Bacteroidia bacterium]
MNIPETKFPRVVIVGGGFGGLSLASSLKGVPLQVVLLDRNNYHTFQPLLYQVASSGLEPDSIAFPIRKIFRNQENLVFRMTEVQEIISEKKILVTSIGELKYDYLVLATGSQTGFFGLKNVEQQSMAMKTIPQALDLRSLILQNFEKAMLSTDVREIEKLLNFVVVGGGPTGVELAGSLAEMKIHVLPADYPGLDASKMQIHLLEAGSRLLPAFSEVSSASTLNFLTDLGVKTLLNTAVKDYDGSTVKVNTGNDLLSSTVIWAAGVEGAPVKGIEGEALLRNKRLSVDEFNRVKGYTSIFAVGDVANMTNDERFPNGHPMVAQPAIQQGELLAKNLKNMLSDKPMKAFQYKDLGSMATVGRNKAVVELPFMKMQGILAWLVWMFVHLMALVGWRNRAVTLVNWMWSYFNYDRGVRLIIRPFKK